MTVARYPTLRLSANGAAAILDTVSRGFRVYDVPGLSQRFGLDSYENVYDVALSSSGAAIAVRTLIDEVLVVTDAGQRTHRLPYPRESLRSLAISDAGDRAALLVALEIASPEARAGDDGSLEVWSLASG